MSTKLLIASAFIGAALAMTPVSASAESPVFGSAKVKVLTTTEMKKVIAQGPVADYYGNKALNQLTKAYNAAVKGYNYDSYANEIFYYDKAYDKAAQALDNLYWAWYYAGS